MGYARAVCAKLKQLGMRVTVDESDARMSGKIRTAQIEKIPYVLVVGGREAENETVAVRSREGGDIGAMTLSEFAALTKEARGMGTAAAIS